MIVLANNLDGVFQQSVLQGATERLGAEGFEVEPVEVGGVQDARELTRLMEEVASKADGVLVISNAVSDAGLAVAMSRGAVATLISHRRHPHPGDRAEQSPPTLMFDNLQGLQQLVAHLVNECGRTKPVFIGGDATQLDAQERERAFLDEAVRHELRVPAANLLAGDFTPERAGEALRRFMDAGGEFDCVIAADYLMGIAAQQTLREAGVKVPEEVAVVGYGDGPEAAAAGVTTVAADVVELGARAARQLLAQLAGERLTGRTLLSTHLIRRPSSC